MEFKVKITGHSCGKKIHFTHIFDTPEFKDYTTEFMGRTLHYSVLDQQKEWLNDNYHLVVEEADKNFLHPIEGFEAVRIKKHKSKVHREKAKKEEVLALLKSMNLIDDMTGLMIGTIHELWPSVKGLKPYQIVAIALRSTSATITVSKSFLDDFRAIFNKTTDDNNLLNQSNYEEQD